MFKNVQELQDFILWAKTEKVKRLKVGDVEVEISDYALVQDLYQTPLSQPSTTEPQKVDEINRIKKEEEDLLLWSAN
jgi:hypothetical protein